MQFERLGPYKIGKRIGRGGMGAVFEGTNVDTGETAAIKVLNPHLADEQGFRERFELEIETLKKLNHPNIVHMLGFGEEQGYLYYAMELVPGRSVEDHVQGGHKFEWRQVVQHGIKLAKALKHAHDHGVIHRDLKPANLLLTTDGDIKLTDFGIARLFGNTRLTLEGGLVGTAEYMSPEQAAGDRITPQSDLYSLGCCMFAMLSGRAPFRANSLADMLNKQRFDPPPAVTRFAPGVPIELEEAIGRMLSKDPASRAPNAGVLSRQLAALEHGLSAVRQAPELKQAPPTDKTIAPAFRTMSDQPASPNPQGATIPAESLAVEPESDAFGATIAHTSQPAASDAGSHAHAADISLVEPTPPSPTIVESRFTTVEEDRRRQEEELSRQSDTGSAIAQIAVLALTLVGVIAALWYFTRPVSADKLYARITAAAEDEDASSLLTVQDDVREFLERFPDDARVGAVKKHQEEIDLQRLEQRFRIRARTLSHDERLSPAERDYMEAMNHVATDPQRTMAMLDAMLTLYTPQVDSQSSTAQCIELAKRQRARLAEQAAQATPAHLSVIDANLRRADGLREQSPAEAQKIWQSIVELYGDKRWAADRVARAKAALENHSAGAQASVERGP